MKAFPCEWVEVKPNTISSSYLSNYQEIVHKESGMDLRDWFAGLAMQAIISSTEEEFTPEEFDGLAKIFYRIGDAMIKAREKE